VQFYNSPKKSSGDFLVAKANLICSHTIKHLQKNSSEKMSSNNSTVASDFIALTTEARSRRPVFFVGGDNLPASPSSSSIHEYEDVVCENNDGRTGENDYNEVFSPPPQRQQQQQQQELIELCQLRARQMAWSAAPQQGFRPIAMPRTNALASLAGLQPRAYQERLINPSDLGPILEKLCKNVEAQEIRLRQQRRDLAHLTVRMTNAELLAKGRERSLHRVNVALMIFRTATAIVIAVLLVFAKYG
jgi:hypothetical protein